MTFSMQRMGRETEVCKPSFSLVGLYMDKKIVNEHSHLNDVYSTEYRRKYVRLVTFSAACPISMEARNYIRGEDVCCRYGILYYSADGVANSRHSSSEKCDRLCFILSCRSM